VSDGYSQLAKNLTVSDSSEASYITFFAAKKLAIADSKSGSLKSDVRDY
jgi:hypothetical protein